MSAVAHSPSELWVRSRENATSNEREKERDEDYLDDPTSVVKGNSLVGQDERYPWTGVLGTCTDGRAAQPSGLREFCRDTQGNGFTLILHFLIGQHQSSSDRE